MTPEEFAEEHINKAEVRYHMLKAANAASNRVFFVDYANQHDVVQSVWRGVVERVLSVYEGLPAGDPALFRQACMRRAEALCEEINAENEIAGVTE